ncbi:MAG TPA: FG-GAP-like repeat-containing protein [Verrucomicrobiae bacterium]|nr:FG-GAP-like repeat-containing protein [Verrucomicrobiae bacterium]
MFRASICVLLLQVVATAALAQAREAAPAPVNLQIIVVESSVQANRVLQRLKNGEDFGAVAKEVSIDPTASDAGYMGRIDPSTLREELRNALKGLSSGQITDVIPTHSGYAILKILPTSETPPVQGTSPARLLPSSATGAIRYAPNVGGKGEADLAFRDFAKPDGWNKNLRAMCDIRQKSLAAVIDSVQKSLDPENPDGVAHGRPLDIIQMHYALANLYAYEGEMEKSIEHWEAAYQIASAQLPGAMPELEEVLGIAYLHKSEMENDVYRHPGNQCIFPPVANRSYAKPADSQKAIEYLMKYLQRKPDALDVRWLLNLAYMTLGKYPAAVPSQYLMAPSVFESTEDVGRFVDVAPEAGINLYSMSGGLVVDDFEGNGLFDIMTSDYGECAPMHFFHNNGDGTFSDRTAQAGLGDQLGGLNLIQADYNNDGCLDVLVLRGAWEFPQRMSLLRNNCNGTFTDVTATSGLDEPIQTQTAVWADIDNDGYLDLFVGNENGPSHLFHNRGDGTFEDISHAAGIDRVGYTKAVAAADYDNDGYVDFYVSNLNGDNVLFHNNRNKTFTDMALQAGVQKPWQSFGAWFFDYNNDGWPDLLVTSYYVSVDESIRSYLGLPPNAETMKLYQNQGDGTFRDVTSSVGLDRVFMPMGANFGDIDNDGFLDMYLGTGNPSYASLLPNVLLHNKDGEFFTDITASSGTGELHKGHGVAFADIDNDGDEDLLEEVGGAVPGDSHAFRLFENPGNKNDWISLHLVGVKTNRAAIGARIKVTVQNAGEAPRTIFRTVGSGGTFGASPLTQHIGMGHSAHIVNLEITWPASHSHQTFANVVPDQFLEIKEFAKDYSRLERHAFRLGGQNRARKPSTAISSRLTGNR